MSLRIAPLMCVVALFGSDISNVYGEDELVTRVYPVADLVVPIPGIGAFPIAGSVVEEPSEPRSPEFEPLVERITTTIQPASWTNAGGNGSIAPQEFNLSLVVRQTKAIHDEISELVHRLRRKKNVQVSVEIRHLDIPDSFFGELGADVLLGAEQTLDESGMKSLMKAVQNHARSNVVWAPKVTLFDGQTAWIGDQRDGSEPSVVLNADVSSDRRSVKLKVIASGIRDGNAVLLSKTIRVPAGHSFLVDRGPLAKESGRDLLLITPRPIVLDEEELLGFATKPTKS